MKKNLLLAFFLFIPYLIFAQNLYSLGENEFTQNKEEATVFTSFKESSYPNLPPRIDLSYLVPPVGDQGTKGACWAWATTYVIRSVMDNSSGEGFFLYDGNPDYSKIFSPEYVYQFYKGNIEDCNWGAISSDMLNKILKDGCVFYDRFIYDDKICNKQPSTDLIIESKKYTKPNYTSNTIRDLFSVKKILSINKQPLVISIKVDNFFCTKGNIIKAFPYWDKFHKKVGSHAMVVVGYDDTLHGGVVKVLNSWGKDFGKDGYVWISYNIIEAAMNYSCYPEKTLDTLPITSQSLAETKSNSLDFHKKNYKKPLSSSFEEGYYVPYKNLKIVLAELDQTGKFAVIEIRNEEYELLTNFYIDTKSSKEFFINGDNYIFTLDNIVVANKKKTSGVAFFTIATIYAK